MVCLAGLYNAGADGAIAKRRRSRMRVGPGKELPQLVWRGFLRKDSPTRGEPPIRASPVRASLYEPPVWASPWEPPLPASL
jgi:hypothetical protein